VEVASAEAGRGVEHLGCHEKRGDGVSVLELLGIEVQRQKRKGIYMGDYKLEIRLD
jgi:hypothetical protein